MFLARTKIPAYGFFSNLMAGILPFGAVFIELFFILSVSRLSVLILMSLLMRSTLLLTLFVLQFLQAIWENQFYYLFGFLFLVFIILAMCCSLIAVVVIYFQLCAEVSILYVFQDYPTIGCKKLLGKLHQLVLYLCFFNVEFFKNCFQRNLYFSQRSQTKLFKNNFFIFRSDQDTKLVFNNVF